MNLQELKPGDVFVDHNYTINNKRVMFRVLGVADDGTIKVEFVHADVIYLRTADGKYCPLLNYPGMFCGFEPTREVTPLPEGRSWSDVLLNWTPPANDTTQEENDA